MVYIRRKTINNQEYFYEQSSERINGKVKTKTVRYIGKSLGITNNQTKNLGTTQSTKEKLQNNAIKEFGTTDKLTEAGYILEDGRMLDFSGKNDGGTPNTRNYDHREINRAINNEQLTKEEREFSKESTYNDVFLFMDKTKATRVDFLNDIKIDTNTKITQEQALIIRRAFIKNRKEQNQNPSIIVDVNRLKKRDDGKPYIKTESKTYKSLVDFEKNHVMQ